MSKTISIGGTNYSTGERTIHLANPTEKSWTRNRFLFQFGAYGTTFVLVWADDLDDALEVAAECLLEIAPGMFTEPAVCEACEGDGNLTGGQCESCGGIGIDDTDLTYTESGYLASWEWYVTENPTREHILHLIGRN